MKNNQFDKNLKGNLQQYISEVDTNSLWANIESEVDLINKKKQKKNRFFFWLLGLGIVFWGGVFYLTKTSLSTTPSIVTSEILSTQITPTVNLEKGNNLIIANGVISNTINSTEIEKNNISKKSISNKQLGKNTSSNNNLFTNQPIEYFFPPENKKMDQGAVKNIPPVEREKEKEKENISSSKETNILPIIASSYFFIKNKPILPLQLLDEDWKFVASDHKRNPPYYSENSLQFSFEIQGGASNTTRSLTKNQTETIDYIDLRKETEKALETVHLAALINITHSSGLELSSGIEWASISEKFEYKGSLIEMDTIENALFGYIINPNGDTIEVFDQVINQSEISYNKRTYNKYQMIGIPILLGYHWRNENWSFGVRGGIIANISLKTSGNIFNFEGQIMDIEEEQNKVFRSKIGLNYSLGLYGKYFITDHLQITINPNFRFFPKSFTLSNYALNQKYYLLGGNVGLRYSF